MMKCHEILVDEVKEIDAVFRNIFQRNHQKGCIATAKTPTHKVAGSKGGRRPLALSEGRLSLTITERKREAFDCQEY